MNFKKMFASSLICASLLLAAPIANASSIYPDDNWANTRLTAEPVKQGAFAKGFMEHSLDQDWFKWTNYTGVKTSMNIYLASPYWENYDITAIYTSSSGGYIAISAPDQGSKGKLDSYYFGDIPPDYTVYWKIVPHSNADVSTTQNYFTWFALQ